MKQITLATLKQQLVEDSKWRLAEGLARQKQARREEWLHRPRTERLPQVNLKDIFVRLEARAAARVRCGRETGHVGCGHEHEAVRAVRIVETKVGR